MVQVEGRAAERVRLARQLAELRAGFQDAARRRKACRGRDPVGEAAAETAIEAAFRTRARILARLEELGEPERVMDAGTGPVRQSSV